MRTLALSLLIAPALAVAAPDLPVTITSLTLTATTTTRSETATTSTAVAAFSTGTESAPGASDGLQITGIKSVSVSVEASGTMTNGGKLNAYGMNPVSGNWLRLPDLDLTVAALSAQAFAATTIPVGVVRLAFVPNGIGTVSGTIYVVGRR